MPNINKVIFGNTTLIDLSTTTLSSTDQLESGVTAYDRAGNVITGTSTGTGAGGITQDQDGYLVLDDDAPPGTPTLISKTITENGTYDADDDDADGYSSVTVNVPSPVPTGIKYVYSDVDGQGAWDVSGYAKCSFDYAPIKDGLCRLWVRLVDSSELTVQLYFYYASSTTYTIDWGDGVKDSFTHSRFARPEHTYSDIGDYVIEIDNGGIISNYIMTNGQQTHNSTLRGAEISVSGATTTYSFSGCDNLIRCSFNEGITTIGNGYLINCLSLIDVQLPSTLTTIGTSFIRGDTAIKKLTIPANVTSIGATALAELDGLELHMKPTTPPTITDTTLRELDYDQPSVSKIYVPSASLSAYQTATYWSAHASKMVGE